MDEVPGGDRQAGAAASRTGRARRRAACPADPHRRGQLRDPQDPCCPAMAGKAPAVPCSFHADKFVLAEPGRALVRAFDRETPAPRRAQVGQAAREGHPRLGGHMERRPHTIDRAGRYRHPQLHEDVITLKGISAPARQIAIKNIGRDEPTLLITNGHDTPAKDLFARYAERMLIENEPGAYISGFSLNALSSAVSLNVDLDTTLTVVAGNLYRLFARNLPRYSRATPTQSGGTSSTTPAPCTSPQTASPST